MDRLESLSNTLSNITMYDIKSMYHQAKNIVLNVSEIEAKVQEATNDDPWGASSTLMQDIANRTFNYPDFNEIMPSIYSRFMEKEARQWRQIYKALQLLEYLIKNGSERVVDDARSHVSTIKMLRNFHYIDDKGKDEGLNIRNRAKEIVELLSDVDKIRAERRKAKANKNKYVGQGNDGLSFSSGGGRFGGFGNDSSSYVGGSGGSGGSGWGGNDYGSYGGRSSFSGGNSFRDDRRGFEEYDAGDDEVIGSQPKRTDSTNTNSGNTQRKASAPTPAPAPVPQPEVNLFDGFDDDTFAAPQPATTKASLATNKDLPAVTPHPNPSLDDEFDSFISAPVAPSNPTPTPALAPVQTPASNANANIFKILDSAQSRPMPTNTTGGSFTQPRPMPTNSTGGSFTQSPSLNNMGMGMGMGHRPTMSGSGGQFPSFTSQPMQPQTQNLFRGAAQPIQPFTSTTVKPVQSQPQAKPASTANFDDLWTMSLGGSAKPTTSNAKSIKDLEKEKTQAGLWGTQQQQQKAPTMGMGLGSSGGFGSFSNAAPQSSGDDLLL